VSAKSGLYEQDFYTWTQEQAALLEAPQSDALDIVNLVEEITSLGASDQGRPVFVSKAHRAGTLVTSREPARHTVESGDHGSPPSAGGAAPGQSACGQRGPRGGGASALRAARALR